MNLNSKTAVNWWVHNVVARPCPVCDGDQFDGVSNTMQHGFDLTTVVCRHCSFVFTNPLPTESVYRSFYKSGYSHYYSTISKRIVKDGSPGVAIEKKLNLVGSFKDLSRSSLLEIGSGNGAFLYASSKLFKEVVGIEPSPEFSIEIQKNGLRVCNGDFEDLDLSGQKFDVIALFHVFEHFYDPNRAIIKVKSLMEADALVVIEVPNILKPFRSLDRYFLRYVHPSSFSPYTLELLLKRHGMQIIYLESGGNSWKHPENIFCIAKKGMPTKFESSVQSSEQVLNILKRYRRSWIWRSVLWYIYRFLVKLIRLIERNLKKLLRRLK